MCVLRFGCQNEMEWSGIVRCRKCFAAATCFAFNYHNGDRVNNDNDNYKVNFHLNKRLQCAIVTNVVRHMAHGVSIFFTSIDGLLLWNVCQFCWLTFLLYFGKISMNEISQMRNKSAIMWIWPKEITMSQLEKVWMGKRTNDLRLHKEKFP